MSETCVYLTDFGLAKSVATGSKLTRTGEALGTPSYMSPEQARGEVSALTPATDIWSLGCVLYETLAGRRAFDGESGAAAIARVLAHEPPRLRAIRGDVPEGAETVVRVCLAKRAGGRYRHASALKEDLDRVLLGEPPRARVPGSRRGLLGLAALLGAAAAAVAFATAPGRGSPAPVPTRGPPPATALLASKARALRSSDPRAAAECLREALSLDPGLHDLRVQRGLLLWALGEGEAACEEWGRIPPESSEGAVAQLYLGLELFFRSVERRVWWDLEARTQLERSAAAPGPQGRLAGGTLLAAKREWSLARKVLAGASGWEADLLRGYVEGTDPQGDRQAAVRHYGAALAAGIPFAWAHVNLATARADLGDFAGALEDSERALSLDPGLAAAWGTRGNAKLGNRDLAGALADYERAVVLDPDNATAWGNLGRVRLELADPRGAIADCDRALALDAASPRALLTRALARQDLGDHEGAIEDYGRILARDERDSGAWTNRGAERARIGDLSGAIADLDRALALDPGIAMAWSNRGAARWQSGDPEAAIADLDRAIALDPGYAFAWANRGAAKAALRDWAGAVSDLETALRAAPPAWPHRAQVENWLAGAREGQARRGSR